MMLNTDCDGSRNLFEIIDDCGGWLWKLAQYGRKHAILDERPVLVNF
jgi:hypothetical protein